MDYEMSQKIMKIVTYIGCGLQIILGIAKLCGTMVWKESLDYIVSVYLILLGVLFLLIEIPVAALSFLGKQFHFIESSIGKAAFSLFLGLLCFNTERWFTIVVGVIWWLIAIAHLVVGIIFYGNEQSSSSTSGTTTNKPQEEKHAVEIQATPDNQGVKVIL